MGRWSGIAKALRSLLKGGGSKAAGSAATSAAASAGSTVVLTWGNTIKVAAVGIFSYLFLTGGASNVVATTLGIPEGLAQGIIFLVFAVMVVIIVVYIKRYLDDRREIRRIESMNEIDWRYRSLHADQMYQSDRYSDGYDRMYYDGSRKGLR